MNEQLTILSAPGSSAVISACGHYRYRLDRRWGPGSSCVFVMLNPSTANSRQDDPTIRKCRGFAQRWGHDAFTVVNLFAWRATHPRDLNRASDPIGEDNDRHIREVCRLHPFVVLAWGNHATRVRIERVLDILETNVSGPLRCLGITKGGEPLHPLMPAYDTPLMEYPL